MNLSFLGVVALTVVYALVLLPEAAESKPQVLLQQPQQPADGGAGLGMQESRAVYYFKRILAYSLLSTAMKAPGSMLGDIWSDCSKI